MEGGRRRYLLRVSMTKWLPNRASSDMLNAGASHPRPLSTDMLVRTWTVKDIATQNVLYTGPFGPELRAAVWKGKQGGRKVSITSIKGE